MDKHSQSSEPYSQEFNFKEAEEAPEDEIRFKGVYFNPLITSKHQQKQKQQQLNQQQHQKQPSQYQQQHKQSPKAQQPQKQLPSQQQSRVSNSTPHSSMQTGSSASSAFRDRFERIAKLKEIEMNNKSSAHFNATASQAAALIAAAAAATSATSLQLANNNDESRRSNEGLFMPHRGRQQVDSYYQMSSSEEDIQYQKHLQQQQQQQLQEQSEQYMSSSRGVGMMNSQLKIGSGGGSKLKIGSHCMPMAMKPSKRRKSAGVKSSQVVKQTNDKKLKGAAVSQKKGRSQNNNSSNGKKNRIAEFSGDEEFDDDLEDEDDIVITQRAVRMAKGLGRSQILSMQLSYGDALDKEKRMNGGDYLCSGDSEIEDAGGVRLGVRKTSEDVKRMLMKQSAVDVGSASTTNYAKTKFMNNLDIEESVVAVRVEKVNFKPFQTAIAEIVHVSKLNTLELNENVQLKNKGMVQAIMKQSFIRQAALVVGGTYLFNFKTAFKHGSTNVINVESYKEIDISAFPTTA